MQFFLQKLDIPINNLNHEMHLWHVAKVQNFQNPHGKNPFFATVSGPEGGDYSGPAGAFPGGLLGGELFQGLIIQVVFLHGKANLSTQKSILSRNFLN